LTASIPTSFRALLAEEVVQTGNYKHPLLEHWLETNPAKLDLRMDELTPEVLLLSAIPSVFSWPNTETIQRFF
jgi:hypothetical protein